MKGRQLTLEEVLRLEDGTKVWVDYENYHYLCFKSNEYGGLMSCEHPNITREGYEISDNIVVSEWIEESYMLNGLAQQRLTIDDSTSIIGRDYNNIISDMAQEICNLRGINLTEDNIDKIMKEFVDKK